MGRWLGVPLYPVLRSACHMSALTVRLYPVRKYCSRLGCRCVSPMYKSRKGHQAAPRDSISSSLTATSGLS